MIGVGLVGFFTILASSSTGSVNSAIDRAIAGDIVIDSGGGLMGGFDPGLARELGKLPQVQAATEGGYRLGIMRAVGMTRHQLRAMIRWESVIIALQGTALAGAAAAIWPSRRAAKLNTLRAIVTE